MRRRVLLLALVAALLLVTPAAASAPGIAVVVNGQPLAAPAVMVNSSVYVPLRAVGEALGAEVGWDGATNTVTVALEPPPPVVRTIERTVTVSVPSYDAASIYRSSRSAMYYIHVQYQGGEGGGTGFAVGSTGTIVTANHVIDYPNATIAVTDNSGGRQTAKVVAVDAAKDIAILGILSPGVGTTALKLTESTPDIGDELGLISCPVGDIPESTEEVNPLLFALTVGRLSGYQASADCLVVDTTAYAGSSGGPLLDRHGNVVGMLVTGFQYMPNFHGAVPAAAIAALLATVK